MPKTDPRIAEPDILDDLEEMWPHLAEVKSGKTYEDGHIAAVMVLAAEEIRRLRGLPGVDHRYRIVGFGGKPAPNWFCRMGFHRYHEESTGQHVHRYFECCRCGRRALKMGRSGHQPINENWLSGGEWDAPRLAPPRRP